MLHFYCSKIAVKNRRRFSNDCRPFSNFATKSTIDSCVTLISRLHFNFIKARDNDCKNKTDNRLILMEERHAREKVARKNYREKL